MNAPAPAPPASRRSVASLMLVLACVCWALSFPLFKALGQAQVERFPGTSTWFLASWSLALRFLVAALALACWHRGALRGCTRGELRQAGGLGLFTAVGMLLQMDGLAYTAASTSAFVTQCTCIFVPLALAVHRQRWPSWPVAAACTLVLAGVGLLSGVDLGAFTLGRGELETIAAALVYTGQILCVSHPGYAGNHNGRVCTLALAIAGLLFLPVAAATMPDPGALIRVFTGPGTLACLIALALVSTLGGMGLMFTFQPRVGAVAAGVIYCTEPIFATLLAFVLPGLLSGWLGIAYADEHFSPDLLIGGTLVIAANLIVLLEPVDRSA